jgi:ferrous iron transport protein B
LLWAAFLATYPRSAAIEKEYEAKRIELLASSASKAGPVTIVEVCITNKIEIEALEALNKEEAGAKLRHSLAGHMGQFLEPAIAPLGFDWKMGIGIVASFAAREVFVSTMSTVYKNIGNQDKSEAGISSLARTLRTESNPTVRWCIRRWWP